MSFILRQLEWLGLISIRQVLQLCVYYWKMEGSVNDSLTLQGSGSTLSGRFPVAGEKAGGWGHAGIL
jgi:hypothetical protein